MGLLSLVLPVVGLADKTEDVKISNALAAIQSWANGGIDATNLANGAVTAEKLGVAVGVHEPGDLKPTARSAAPGGWLLCQGQAVSRVTYATLYAAIGTAFGEGDKSTTFNIPDGRGRAMIGAGEPVGAAGATSHALGSKGGEETHTLTTAELASHLHSVNDPGHLHSVNDPGHSHTTQGSSAGPLLEAIGKPPSTSSGSNDAALAGGALTSGVNISLNTAGTNISLNTSGSGTAHNNLQPFFTGNWLIKY
jgi:microcystin-dependent protein